MKNRDRLGGWLAVLAAVIGIFGHFYIFVRWYKVGMAAESAEPGCEILLRYIQPAIFDIGILGGVAFALSAYGFFTARKWAFPIAVIGIVLALQGSWFINVPYMAAGLPPVYFTLFWPYLALYFLFLLVVGRVSWPRTLVSMVSGMTYVFCLMNGVASLSRIITIGDSIFFAVQRLHWVAMVGWGIVTVALLLQVRPNEWVRVLGLFAGGLELTVGVPLAVATAMQMGRFSLFSLAPIFSLVIVVLFVWPWAWSWLLAARGDAASPSQPSPATQTA